MKGTTPLGRPYEINRCAVAAFGSERVPHQGFVPPKAEKDERAHTLRVRAPQNHDRRMEFEMREHHRIVRWLANQGARSVAIVHKRRHPRCTLNWDGCEHSLCVSGSLRCSYRAVRNAITQLKRLISSRRSSFRK